MHAVLFSDCSKLRRCISKSELGWACQDQEFYISTLTHLSSRTDHAMDSRTALISFQIGISATRIRVTLLFKLGNRQHTIIDSCMQFLSHGI